MGYRNAQEIFPEGLLKQIQRYVSGETIYIPARDERKAWGETSGYQHISGKEMKRSARTFQPDRPLRHSWTDTRSPTIPSNELCTTGRRLLC